MQNRFLRGLFEKKLQSGYHFLIVFFVFLSLSVVFQMLELYGLMAITGLFSIIAVPINYLMYRFGKDDKKGETDTGK